MRADRLDGKPPAGEGPLDGEPQGAREQLSRVAGGLEQLLRGNLAGIYLHGSLAMGCFNPRSSDLDLLAVTERSIERSTKGKLLELLLSESGSPFPIEISVVPLDAIAPWQYPTPFDLHYSETWRRRCEQTLYGGEDASWLDAPGVDADLAAHIAVARVRGVVLCGGSAAEVLPAVPPGDLLDSLLSDLRWARERLDREGGALYGVLNACRVCAYLREGGIRSKAEGARWALGALPARHHTLIRAALSGYRAGDGVVDSGSARALIDEVLAASQR